MLNIYEYSSIPESLNSKSDSESESVCAPTLLASDNTLSYLSQYENKSNKDGYNKSGSNKGRETFRKEHCRKGHLVSKDQKVRIDMAQHVYPEVSFVNEKCNICDSTCDFTVSDKIISTGIKEGFAPISCRG
jgi:hypothetical protein